MVNTYTERAGALNRIIKARAHVRVRYALKAGWLQKPDKCTRCGKEGRVEAHHQDYLWPLAVEWVCLRCQRKIHAELVRTLRKTADRILPPPRKFRGDNGRFIVHPSREVLRRKLGRYTAPAIK